MTKTNDQITNLDAELDGLSSPTTADTYVVSKDYDPDVVAASAARRALGGGGGGGSLPAWFQSGAGSPVGTVDPEQAGAVYFDTTNGGMYLAAGATDTDWIVFGVDPNAIGGTAGVEVRADNKSVAVLAGHQDTPLNGTAVLADAYSYWNGNSNGLEWIGNGTDGEQILQVKTGGHLSTLADADGNMSPAGTVIDLPDPTNAQDAATKAYVDNFNGPLTSDLDANGNDLLNVATITGAGVAHTVELQNGTGAALEVSDSGLTLGTLAVPAVAFYGATPIAKQTGVAVDAEAIHAALVNLGLIGA